MVIEYSLKIDGGQAKDEVVKALVDSGYIIKCELVKVNEWRCGTYDHAYWKIDILKDEISEESKTVVNISIDENNKNTFNDLINSLKNIPAINHKSINL